jgi:glycosyltransferase involved in cell wall biosynthesis
MLSAPYGWAYDLAEGLSKGIVRRGHVLTIVSTNSGWPSLPSVPTDLVLDIGGASLQYFPISSWASRSNLRLVRTLAPSGALSRAMPRMVQSADLVHIHMLYTLPTIVGARAAIEASVPFIVSPYGSLDPYMHARRGRLRKELFLALFRDRVLNRAASLHYMSDQEFQLATRFALRPKPAIVPLGIATEKYGRPMSRPTFRARWPDLEAKKLIMYLGRISYTKGLDLLVLAFSRVASKHSDAHLVLVGPDYEGYGLKLRGMLSTAGLTGRVTFTGLVSEEDKYSALSDADIFILPSHTEAFGLVMLEAMASKVPVITTDRAALSAEFASANAALVAKSNVDSLAQAIDRLLEDQALRSQLATAGYQLVNERFTWDQTAGRFVDLYQRLLSKR